MKAKGILIVLAAAVSMGAVLFCESCGGDKEVRSAQDETDAAAGEGEAQAREGIAPEQSYTHLSTVHVKAVDPPDAVEAAGAVETLIAFNNIGLFVDCEQGVPGGDTFRGTIVVQFGIDEAGELTGDPGVVLTTSSQEGELETCMAEALGEIDFSSLSLESPVEFHLILKFKD